MKRMILSKRFYVSEHAVRDNDDWRYSTAAAAVAAAQTKTANDGIPRGVVEVLYVVTRDVPTVVARVTK